MVVSTMVCAQGWTMVNGDTLFISVCEHDGGFIYDNGGPNGNYTSADEFKKDLVEYIDYYNNDRIKLRLGGISPVKYRLMHTVSNNV